MSKRSILITGASGDSYGAGIAKQLEDEFDVYTMQRHPGEHYSKWFDHDLEHLATTPRALLDMDQHVGPKADKPSFWAVIHCSSVQTELHLGTVNSMEISNLFNANVAEPIKIISYLLSYALLEWSGKVIFLNDTRSLGPDLALYQACKRSMRHFVDAMRQEWPANLDILYVDASPKTQAGAIEDAGMNISKLLNNQE